MRAFAYVAFTADGARRTGSVVAETETAAADQLQAQGLYVSDLTAKAARSAWWPARALLGSDLQAVFTRQMAVLLGAEMPVEAALEAVRQGGHRALETAAARARAQLMDGATLSESLSASNAGFPAYYIASVEAGERAGDLSGVFAELADFLERQGEDKAVIGTALIYPAFVAAVSLLVCGILMVNVAPEVVRMFALTDRPLPQITQVVLAASNWIERNILPLGIVGMALVALGMVNGLLPCGLVYGWLAAAATTGGAATGALTLAVFGLGTIPALALTGVLGGRLRPTSRLRMQRLAGVLVVLVGLLTVARGASALTPAPATGETPVVQSCLPTD